MDKLHFDRTDYSVVVKNRAPPPSSWKWEIYRAGRSSPVKQLSIFFHTMVTANRAGKEARMPLSAFDWRRQPELRNISPFTTLMRPSHPVRLNDRRPRQL